MVAKSKKNAAKKKGSKEVKVLNLKRESIKDLTSRQKKKIKGGGGSPGGVIQDRKLTDV